MVWGIGNKAGVRKLRRLHLHWDDGRKKRRRDWERKEEMREGERTREKGETSGGIYFPQNVLLHLVCPLHISVSIHIKTNTQILKSKICMCTTRRVHTTN